MNKRGFEMVWGTIVTMILALTLLILIVMFFTTTSGSFIDRIRSYSGYSNVDAVVEGCNILQIINSQYAFCCEEKNVKYYLNGKSEGMFNCGELVDKDFIGGKINSLSCDGVSC